jgi:hypothetical protein
LSLVFVLLLVQIMMEPLAIFLGFSLSYIDSFSTFSAT